MVCGPPEFCVSGSECIPACQSDTDCGSAESVCRSGHCVAKPCNVDADCPSIGISDYACSAGVCTPKPCTNDSDCHGGFCVNRVCATQQGFCASGAA
jgi:hypothetical protein